MSKRFVYDFEMITFDAVIDALEREIQRLGTGGNPPNPPPQQGEKQMKYWELVEFLDAVRQAKIRIEDE